MDLVSKVISDIEQMGCVVVSKKGYLLIYSDKNQCIDCICLIYNQDFLQQHIDFTQPMYFIVLGKEVNLSDWGVSKELVSRFEYPFFERLDNLPLKVNGDRSDKIFYILDDVTNGLNANISLSVIKSFNCLLHLKFCCIVPDSLIPLLEQVANNHITLLKNTGDYSSFYSECDLLIASERTAAKGLLSNIPVIVVGKYGFGGLVTNDNLISFLPNRFSGRPGGNLSERISPVLLVQEINYVLDVMNTKELDDLVNVNDHTIDCMNAFCLEYIFDSLKGIISEKKLLREHIHDDYLILQIKPKLSSDIIVDKIEESPEEIFLLRNVTTNKVFATMSDFEATLIQQCNGKNCVSDLVVILGEDYNINDCVEFLRSLWELGNPF